MSSLKEILKPTEGRIILAVIATIILVYFYISGYFVGVVGTVLKLPLYLSLVATDLCLEKATSLSPQIELYCTHQYFPLVLLAIASGLYSLVIVSILDFIFQKIEIVWWYAITFLTTALVIYTLLRKGNETLSPWGALETGIYVFLVIGVAWLVIMIIPMIKD